MKLNATIETSAPSQAHVFVTPTKSKLTQSPKSKTSFSATMTSPTKSVGKMSTSELGGTSIPFSQRQSKSLVNAYEALKKSKQQSNHSADRMIDEAIQEYEKFYGRHTINANQWR